MGEAIALITNIISTPYILIENLLLLFNILHTNLIAIKTIIFYESFTAILIVTPQIIVIA